VLGMEARQKTRELIAPIERAVKDDRVTGLARVLAQLDISGAFSDPDLFAPPSAEHYQRRLVWRDPNDRFVVVAMTWAPGQGSPLHDHGGLWGAEIVVSGSMHAMTYGLIDKDAAGLYRFACEEDGCAPRHSVGVLTPPLEYHTFCNTGSTTAQTIHVYGGTFEFCNMFVPVGEDRWRSERVDLRYDA
jgi:3-mercaptopropionate dioxygenase